MKNLNLTEYVRRKRSFNMVNIFDYLPATIANVFSVLFATSIILELKDLVNGFVLVFLSLFIILFLIMNEIIKVKEIRKIFTRDNKNNSILAFLVTFVISISLSSIGIWLYTNKAEEVKNSSKMVQNELIETANKEFNEKVNNIHSIPFENTKEYESLNSELNFWKNRRAANLEEREYIRENVLEVQNNIKIQREKYSVLIESKIQRERDVLNSKLKTIETKFNNMQDKADKNNFISYIFLSLILITEFATILLNKNLVDKKKPLNNLVDSKLSKTYIIASSILSSLYLTNKKDDVININNVKYSYANKDNFLNWDEIKILYNNFISLGIIDKGRVMVNDNTESELIYNKMLLEENKAMEKLDTYFNKLLNINL